MITKLIIVSIMMIILFALGRGLFFLVRDKGKTERSVKALTWRIILSLSLFVFLFIAFKLHWITPHGL
jgi:hypothetical protein